MNYRRLKIGVIGLLGAGLVAGTGLASAHGVHGVSGTVSAVSATGVQVTVKGVTQTVATTSSTRVIKQVAGTTADLTAGTRVSLQVSGTTVNAIRIEGGLRGPKTGTHTGTTPKPVSAPAHPRPSHPAGPRPANPNFAGGQVVSLNGNQLTLKVHGGTNATYTLAAGVQITKFVAGTLADLHSGETIQVRLSRSGSAAEIVILS